MSFVFLCHHGISHNSFYILRTITHLCTKFQGWTNCHSRVIAILKGWSVNFWSVFLLHSAIMVYIMAHSIYYTSVIVKVYLCTKLKAWTCCHSRVIAILKDWSVIFRSVFLLRSAIMVYIMTHSIYYTLVIIKIYTCTKFEAWT